MDYYSWDALQGVLMLIAFMFVFTWTYLLIRLVQIKICGKQCAAISLCAVLSYLFYHNLREHISEWPLRVCIISFSFQTVVAFITAVFIYRQEKTHLSAMSFREGFDTLPAGLCFYTAGGMPKMVNYRMDSLYFNITGEHLSNGEEFWQKLSDGAYQCSVSGGKQPIICLPDGTAFSFMHSVIKVRNEDVYELIASDITGLYNLAKELEEKKKRSQQINARLRALNSTMRYVIMEKELLAIKTRIHDELGQSLLLGRRYLASPDKVDADQMLKQWKNTFGLLLYEEREDWQKPYLVNTRRAELLGVKLTVEGVLPEEEHLIAVIDTAIAVHTTNVQRHAEGTEAYIRITEDERFYNIYFTNNGKAPEKGIRESGGLLNLRRMAERAGGGMKIRSLPAFEMALKLPKEKITEDFGDYELSGAYCGRLQDDTSDV
ncbi:sensor histidine kinase [Ruminococcus sp. HUN007]|uniref:sensor histidine kinase n=1 Tax=Ruminococcus sp. HUN007 TaxID=1514668 RepID=UPI0005D26C97|nr:sensor histidine kinase [Ruminococcus sp. HUN007]